MPLRVKISQHLPIPTDHADEALQIPKNGILIETLGHSQYTQSHVDFYEQFFTGEQLRRDLF